MTVFHSSSIGEQTKIGIEGAEILAEIQKQYGKPIIAVKFRDLAGDTIITEILKRAGIPMYQTPEDYALAMSALLRYAAIKNR